MSFLAEPLALYEPSLRHMFAVQLQASSQKFDEPKSSVADYLPTLDELIVADGVAVIPIHGVMVKRSQIWSGWWSSRVIVGSDHWSQVIGDFVNRTDIETLVFDFDTGGGQVSGTERLAEAIWKAQQAGKRTIAVANEFCASAGLWAASQCERIVIPATGSIGSLGVFMIHMDDTKALAEWGFEKTTIHRGKYKGLHERALDADATQDLQRYIDSSYSLFIDAVARGRGLSVKEVTEKWGESQVFTGMEAVSSGLADELGTLQDVLESLRAGRGGRVSIDVPPADSDPESDPEGDPEAMIKLNSTGQLLDSAGKVIGNISELQMDAAGLTKYFAAQTGELIESAVRTANEAAAETQKAALAEADKARISQLDSLVVAVGPEKAVVAFKAGQSVESAKAALTDDLKSQLAAKDAEIVKLRESGGRAPAFVASDSRPELKGATTEDRSDRTEYADEWDSNVDNCREDFRNEKEFAAYQRRHG